MSVNILKKIKNKCIFYITIKKFALLYYFPKSLNTVQRDRKVIVSLTSFSKRLENLYLVIESIYRQSYKPDGIELYLGDDVEISTIPQKIMNYKKYGLKIITNVENLKPHKKYFFSMLNHKDDIVVTFDDDNIIDKSILENLINCYKKNGNAVSSTRAHRMKFDENGMILPYNKWDLEYVEEIEKPRYDLVATGVGGVLYPPHLLCDELFNKEIIIKYALNVDDIWLKIIEILSNVPVAVTVQEKRPLIGLPSQYDNSLSSGNVGEMKNDKCISELIKHYGLQCKDFKS